MSNATDTKATVVTNEQCEIVGHLNISIEDFAQILAEAHGYDWDNCKRLHGHWREGTWHENKAIVYRGVAQKVLTKVQEGRRNTLPSSVTDAAPDMLEALRIVASHDLGGLNGTAYAILQSMKESARTAIAKAEGRS